jgi:hypothetical protein
MPHVESSDSDTKAKARPGNGPPAAESKAKQPPPDPRQGVVRAIDAALSSIDQQLAIRLWLFADPERRKALSRARDFLQRIRERIGDGGAGWPEGVSIDATKLLVERAADLHRRVGRENAWDFAEELRVTSLAFLSDGALVCLLEREKADESSITWAKLFPADKLDGLLARPPGFREEALERLRRLHHERVDRVRHDRARDKIWQQFVWKLIPFVYALHIGCLYRMNDPKVYLPVLAGAVGAMLSGVIKLRDSEQRIRHLRRSASFLFLQPMVGATAALVMHWVGVTEMLKDGAFTSATNASALLGFLAGFSEPFFLGTMGRLTELAGNGKGKAEGEGAGDGLRKKANS